MVGVYFHLAGLTTLILPLSRLRRPRRVEGQISFQPQSAGIQSDGDES